MWKKILKYRVLASDFVKHKVQNGKNTSFWHDNWSPFGRLIEILDQRRCIDMGIGLQETVADVITTHR